MIFALNEEHVAAAADHVRVAVSLLIAVDCDSPLTPHQKESIADIVATLSNARREIAAIAEVRRIA